MMGLNTYIYRSLMAQWLKSSSFINQDLDQVGLLACHQINVYFNKFNNLNTEINDK